MFLLIGSLCGLAIYNGQIIDLKFPKPLDNPAKTAIDLKMIPGVVETGLFIGMTDEVHVGTEDKAYIIKK